MGANLSNQNTSNTLSSFNSLINQTVSSVLQNSQTNCSSSNTFRGLFGSYPTNVNTQTGDIQIAECGGTFNSVVINQIAQGTCNLTAGITSDVQANITNQLSTNINQWLTQNATQNNNWLALFVLNASNEGITNTTDLSNQIANTISSNISQTCSAFVAASNLGAVSYCGNYPNGIVVNQSAISQNLTSCIVNNTVTLIARNQVLNDIVTKTSQQTAQTNEGLSTIARYIIIAVVAVVILIIIGVILYFVFGGSKAPAPTNAMDAKEREKRMLERELIEKRERQEGKPANSLASFTTRGNADESARQLFERHDELTSPTYLDRFHSLASRYGGVAEAEL